MTPEQKAKAYDKVREKIVIRFGSNVAEEIFSQFEMSEDERIREELIQYFKKFTLNTFAGLDPKKILSWIEKQGEKASDKIVEKAKTEKQRVLLTETDGSANIDWNCRSLDDVKILLKCGLEFIRTIEANKQILIDSRFGGCSFRVPTRYDKGVKQSEQKSVDKAEHKHTCELNNSYTYVKFPFKAKVKSSGKIVTIHGGQLGFGGEEWIKYQSNAEDRYKVYEPNDLELVCEIKQNPSWSNEDEINYNYALAACKYYGESTGYADTKTHQKANNWLKSLKDKMQPKQEWSEDDEDKIVLIKKAIYSLVNDGITFTDATRLCDWLKSLKDRYAWKPSDKQMEALDWALSLAKNCGEECAFDLRTLQDQLKELKG